MSDRLSLTADQQTAVDAADSRILLLAPAGSGKTEVLARRVERILGASQGEAFRVLTVTYTVKAAEELRSRIEETVSRDAWRMDCSTLHAFALDLLRRYGSSVGVGPGVVVFSDDTDRVRVIEDYLRTLGHSSGVISPALVRAALSDMDEARTFRPREALRDKTYGDLSAGLVELYDAYLGGLAKSNGIDFPGMLSKLIDALDADAWIAENFQRTYGHVLIDEAQDLTPAQVTALSGLIGDAVSVFGVADERQSINAFSGGGFENARRLVGSEATTLHLHHNFRCSRAVLDAAERVAEQLATSQRAPDGTGAPPGDFTIAKSPTERDEASDLTSWIEVLLANGLPASVVAPGEDTRVAPEEIAVIARARWQLAAIIERLRERSISTSLNLDASGFLAHSEGRLFFETLGTIADPTDRPAKRRFADEFAVVTQIEAAESDAYFDALTCLDSVQQPTTNAIAAHVRQFTSNTHDLEGLLASLGAHFAGALWSEDAAILQRLWESYRISVNAPRRSLKGFLRHVAKNQTAKPSDPGVRILTIHRVKGLEFKAVAIVGAYEGAIPDFRARSLKQLQEERRTLYVAMTRARRTLRVSWPQTTRDRYDRIHHQQPSRFLLEAGLLPS